MLMSFLSCHSNITLIRSLQYGIFVSAIPTASKLPKKRYSFALAGGHLQICITKTKDVELTRQKICVTF